MQFSRDPSPKKQLARSRFASLPALIRWEECGTVVPPSSDSAAIAAAGGEGVCYLPQVEIIPLRACLADLEHSG